MAARIVPVPGIRMLSPMHTYAQMLCRIGTSEASSQALTSASPIVIAAMYVYFMQSCISSVEHSKDEDCLFLLTLLRLSVLVFVGDPRRGW